MPLFLFDYNKSNVNYYKNPSLFYYIEIDIFSLILKRMNDSEIYRIELISKNKIDKD